MLWQIVIVVVSLASALSYFVPTPTVLVNSFKSGQTFFASGDYKKAIEQFDEILATKSVLLNADSVKVSILNGEFVLGVRTAAYYQKANSLSKLQRYEESAGNFRLVEQSNDMPRVRAMAQAQLYNLYFKQKMYDSAVVEARKLVVSYPGDEKAPQAQYDIGWAFLSLHQPDSSSRAFTDLIMKFPKSQFDVRARYQIGQNYFDGGDYQHAADMFQDLVTLYLPEKFDAKAWENVELKTVRDKMKFDAAAGKDEDQSNLELVAKASIKIGDCFARMNEFDKALAQFRSVISQYSLMPTLVEITYIKMAELTLSVKGVEEAVYVYQRAIDESFGKKDLQAKLQYKIAKTYEEQKAYNKSAEEYAFFMRAYPDVQSDVNFTLEQANLNAVLMYYNGYNYRSAIAFADTFRTRFPESSVLASILLVEGTSYNNLKQYDSARATLRTLIERYPDFEQKSQAQLIIARSYVDEKKFDIAIPTLIEVRDQCPEQAQKDEANFWLLTSYYETQKYAEGTKVFPEIPYGSAFYGPAIGKAAKCYGALKKYDDGKKMLSEIRERAKTDTIGYPAEVELASADIYVAEAKLDSAIFRLGNLLSSKAAKGILRYQALYVRGVLYSLNNQYKESIADLEQTVASDTFKTQLAAFVPAATEKIAFSLIQIGNRKRGFDLLQKLIDGARNEEEKTRFLAMMSDAQFKAGEYAKGAEIADKIIGMKSIKDETRIRAYSTAINCYAGLTKVDRSIEYIKVISEQYTANPASEDIVYEFASLLYDNAGLDYAARVYTIYMKSYPAGKYIKSVRPSCAYCYSRMGKIDEAIALYNTMIKEETDPAKITGYLYSIADLYYGTKDYERAIKSYRSLYLNHPNSPDAPRAMYGEAWSYNLLQKQDSMASVLKAMVKKYPKEPSSADALFTIGDYYYNKQQYHEAMIAYSQIMADFPAYARVEEAKSLVHELDQITAYLEYEKAMQLFDAKNYASAIGDLERVLTKFPGTDIALGCRANIASGYEQIGQLKRAKELFQKIVDEYRDSTEAYDVTIFAQQHVRWIESKL